MDLGRLKDISRTSHSTRCPVPIHAQYKPLMDVYGHPDISSEVTKEPEHMKREKGPLKALRKGTTSGTSGRPLSVRGKA